MVWKQKATSFRLQTSCGPEIGTSNSTQQVAGCRRPVGISDGAGGYQSPAVQMIRADGTQEMGLLSHPRNQFRGYKMSHAYGIRVTALITQTFSYMYPVPNWNQYSNPSAVGTQHIVPPEFIPGIATTPTPPQSAVGTIHIRLLSGNHGAKQQTTYNGQLTTDHRQSDKLTYCLLTH